jgi:hypothetical protein
MITNLRSPEHCDALDFVEALRDSVPPLHPSAASIVHEWLNLARCASHISDTREVVRLMNLVKEKIAIELHWEAEVDEDIGDYVAAGALHTAADKWDSTARDLLYGPRRRRRRKNPPSAKPMKNYRRPSLLPPPSASPPHDQMATKPSVSSTPSTQETTMTDRAANVPPTITESAINQALRQDQAIVDATGAPIPQPRAMSRIMDMAMAATPERLSKPHQIVTLKNTDPHQTHWFTDRFHRGHELKPGQSKELDMLVEEIQHHARLLRTDRGYYESGPRQGLAFPAHPVKIVGLEPRQSAPQST